MSRPEAMNLTLPTWLTLLRIVMIPVLVLAFYLPYKWTNFACAAVFGLAAVSYVFELWKQLQLGPMLREWIAKRLGVQNPEDKSAGD